MKNAITVIFILFTIHFWRYTNIPPIVFKLADFITYLVFGYFFLGLVQSKILRFKNAIILFLIGIFLNILSAYFNNGQDPRDTFLSVGFYTFILFYFALHELKVERKSLENIIIIFAILYSIFYLIQKAAFPQVVFIENMFSDRGTIRMRIAGDGFLMLAYFLLLNRYLIKRNLFDLFLALFFFFILILAGFRTLLAGGVILSGFMFIRLVKYSPMNYFLIVLAVISFLGLMQMEKTSTIINNMINTSEKQQEQGDRYIRKLQYKYFTEEYPQNFSYYVVGGGFPGAKGAYTYKMGFMISEYGFYWVDLGLLGFWLVMGAVTMAGLLWFTFKGMFLKLPPDGLYLNIYFAFLFLVTNITLNQMYRFGIFGVEAIALYLIDIIKDEEEEKLKIKSEIPEPDSLISTDENT
jgi:hypothetical protein